MLVFYSEEQSLHAPLGELRGEGPMPALESPYRAERVLARLRESERYAVRAAEDHGADAIEAVHRSDYLDFLRTIWRDWREAGRGDDVLPRVWPSRSMAGRTAAPSDPLGRAGFYALSGETPITETTWRAAYGSAQVALSGAEALSGGASSAFGLCRPPGHHASSSQYGGYCFLNNAAIAAARLRAGGSSRVSILDVGFHHGNGTQEIFYGRSDVYYFSLHGDPEFSFPHFSGYADETGHGAGEGYNYNVPYPPGTGWSLWYEGLQECLRRMGNFGSESLVVSLGLGSYSGDPLGSFHFTREDYMELGRVLGRLGVPTLFLLEGGFDLESLADNVDAVLSSFSDARGS